MIPYCDIIKGYITYTLAPTVIFYRNQKNENNTRTKVLMYKPTDEDMSSMHMTCLEIEDKEISEGVLTEKEVRSSSGSSHQGGGPNQVRAHLGFQDQSIIKLVTRMHPGSIFKDPRMDGKLIR